MLPQPKHVVVGDGLNKVTFGNDLPFVWIAGPCQIESREHAFKMARELQEIAKEEGVSFVFKASFDKANRTSDTSARGVGIEEGLKILGDIRTQLGCAIITDIHERDQAEVAAKMVDILQIPALLSRQTDLIKAAAVTGKAVNIKKGQFMAPQDMGSAAKKVFNAGNPDVLLTERGSSFGYNNLIVDIRGLDIMKETGCPVIMDATHAAQTPSSNGTSSGGNRDHAVVLADAAMGVGVAGLFTEVHDDPDHALSDGPNSLRLDQVRSFLRKWKKLDQVTKEHSSLR